MNTVHKDPVCDMTVGPFNDVLTIQYKGRTYYFCSQLCKILFEREPEKYLNKSEHEHHHH